MEQQLAKVVGSNVARLRKARGWSQEDLAHHARRIGLRWDRSAVARLETGRVSITFEDVLLLVNVLQVKLADLLHADASQVIVGEAKITAETLLHLPEGDRFVLPGAVELLRDTGIVATADPRWIRRAREYGFHVDEMEAALYAINETDRRVAERLGVEPEEVVLASRHLWKMGLSRKRDERVTDAQDEALATGKAVGAVRGLRGRETRILIQQLREHLDSKRR